MLSLYFVLVVLSTPVRVLIGRLIMSVILAYPLSGCMIGVASLMQQPSLIQHPIILALEVLWFTVATPLYGGFPPADEGLVHYKNMYPWIAFTGACIFFVKSKGWLWFRRR
jgi:hypothetical protein